MSTPPSTPNEMVSPRLKAVSPQRAALERGALNGVENALNRASWEQCRFIGAHLALLFFAAGKKRRALGIANVQMALGVNRAQATRIARRSVQNWGMTMCEFLHASAASEAELRDYVSLEGQEHLEAALALGKGAVLLMAHMGNWELVGARLVQEHPLSPVVRPLSNASVQSFISRLRYTSGLKVIDKYGGGRPIVKALRAGESVAMIADRHAGPEGALLPLFGRLTRFESGPARMAMMSGAPILPFVGVRRSPWLSNGRIRGRILPAFHIGPVPRAEREAAVEQGTRQVIASLESLVREYPDQWTWMLRRWRDDDASPSHAKSSA